MNELYGLIQTSENFFLADDGDDLENARAGGPAGEGHPDRLGDLAQLQAAFFHDRKTHRTRYECCQALINAYR